MSSPSGLPINNQTASFGMPNPFPNNISNQTSTTQKTNQLWLLKTQTTKQL
jgi:hypothetical protein